MKASRFARRGAALALAAALCACAAAPKRADWVALFDGKRPQTLANWNRVGEDNWRIEGDTVMADASSTPGSTFLVSKESYGDVEIRAEVWVTSDTNSGIFFRCAVPAAISVHNCYEMNIWDNYKVQYYATGSIALFAKVDPVPHAGGKWSTFDITARGAHLKVLMDGVKTVEIDDSTYRSGPIGLQWGGGIVKWRSVQVRRLD